jgi:hypothetical protein
MMSMASVSVSSEILGTDIGFSFERSTIGLNEELSDAHHGHWFWLCGFGDRGLPV